MLLPLLRAARPRQWIKNLFVGAPLIFAKSLRDEHLFLRSAAAVLIFCLISSSVYLWNDIVDVEKDRLHPRKRLRPIASGELPIPVARAFSAAFAALGLSLAYLLRPEVALVAGLYLVQNVAYSLWLKHVAYVDVIVIAMGFLLRVVAGALAIPVAPSRWLLVCTALVASFNGFGKRSHELSNSGATARSVLAGYHPERLRVAFYATGAATVLAYLFYTLSDHTRTFFGTNQMIYTVPGVAIGVARFVQLSARSKADSPTEEMLRDPLFIANIAAWVVAVVAIIYLAGPRL